MNRSPERVIHIFFGKKILLLLLHRATNVATEEIPNKHINANPSILEVSMYLFSADRVKQGS